MTSEFPPPAFPELGPSGFGYRSTAEQVTEGIDLTGKVAIVTGALSGIGKETARVLALRGAHVFVAGRSQERCDEVVAEFKRTIPSNNSNNLDTLVLDLASQASVKAAAADFLARNLPLHILVCNAGIMASPLEYTEDGFESQFGVNYLGHFTFTLLLLPALLKAGATGGGARVILTSSIAHRFSGVDLEDVNFRKREYNKWVSYGQSKTAAILLALELGKRLESKGIVVNSLHPGGIVTNLGRNLSADEIKRYTKEDGTPLDWFKTIPEGAATQTWLAAHPDAAKFTGKYCEDCNVYEAHTPAAKDPDTAAKLFTLSEELTGVKFDDQIPA